MAKSKTISEKDCTKTLMVYVGMALGGKGNLVYRWRAMKSMEETFDDPDSYTQENHFKSNLERGARVGAIYLIPATDTGALINTGDVKGQYADEEAVASWQARSHAAKQTHRERKGAFKEASKRMDLERLRPFRSLYERSDADRRAFILANVVRYITSRGD